jgi:hypothetical protein
MQELREDIEQEVDEEKSNREDWMVHVNEANDLLDNFGERLIQEKTVKLRRYDEPLVTKQGGQSHVNYSVRCSCLQHHDKR